MYVPDNIPWHLHVQITRENTRKATTYNDKSSSNKQADELHSSPSLAVARSLLGVPSTARPPPGTAANSHFLNTFSLIDSSNGSSDLNIQIKLIH